jgi:hypothetical protein
VAAASLARAKELQFDGSLRPFLWEARMRLTLPDLPQRFAVSHPNEVDFKGGGLREYSAYRDAGVRT